VNGDLRAHRGQAALTGTIVAGVCRVAGTPVRLETGAIVYTCLLLIKLVFVNKDSVPDCLRVMYNM
jgi:hypothetical protein